MTVAKNIIFERNMQRLQSLMNRLKKNLLRKEVKKKMNNKIQKKINDGREYRSMTMEIRYTNDEEFVVEGTQLHLINHTNYIV